MRPRAQQSAAVNYCHQTEHIPSQQWPCTASTHLQSASKALPILDQTSSVKTAKREASMTKDYLVEMAETEQAKEERRKARVQPHYPQLPAFWA